MKAIALACFVTVCPAVAQDAPAPLTVELRTGEKLSVTKISKVEPDGITVWTDAGVKKIPVAKLAKVELSRFSLDEKTAQEHATAVAQQEAAYAKQQAQAVTPAPAGPERSSSSLWTPIPTSSTTSSSSVHTSMPVSSGASSRWGAGSSIRISF